MFNYLRSNCDIGCKTVWSEMLLCIKEDHCGSFYKEFHGSDIMYAHALTSMMLFGSQVIPMLSFLAQNTWDFP